MIGLLMILAGVIMVIAGFTGRWRALLHAIAPSFSHAAPAQSIGSAVKA